MYPWRTAGNGLPSVRGGAKGSLLWCAMLCTCYVALGLCCFFSTLAYLLAPSTECHGKILITFLGCKQLNSAGLFLAGDEEFAEMRHWVPSSNFVRDFCGHWIEFCTCLQKRTENKRMKFQGSYPHTHDIQDTFYSLA